MRRPAHPRDEAPEDPAPRSRLAKLGHLLFWTALFYLLTWGIAMLCERAGLSR